MSPVQSGDAKSLHNALQRLHDLRREFNAFEVLGAFGLERTHHHMLVWLLDPRGSHELADGFLKLFVRRVAPSLVDRFGSDSNVVPEVGCKGGRIDIVVRSASDDIGIIEVKTFADAYNPFEAYEAYAVSARSHWYAFVSPNGQGHPRGWSGISYSELSELLAQLELSNKRSHQFIRDYRNQLDRWFTKRSAVAIAARSILLSFGQDALEAIDQQRYADEIASIERIRNHDASAIEVSLRSRVKREIASDAFDIKLRGAATGTDFSPRSWPHRDEAPTNVVARFSIDGSTPYQGIWVRLYVEPRAVRENVRASIVASGLVTGPTSRGVAWASVVATREDVANEMNTAGSDALADLAWSRIESQYRAVCVVAQPHVSSSS